METLEGSTLELLYRRRVRTFYPGYTIILLLAGIIVSLPLVKVSLVATAGGMVRNSSEALELYPGTPGIVEHCMLEDFREVSRGDTLLQLSMALPMARLEELEELEKHNKMLISDIYSILNSDGSPRSSRYRQAQKMHRTACGSLEFKRDFMEEEFKCAADLYREQVIPLREFEQTRSQYRLACMEVEDRKESFLGSLEVELMRLERENLRLGAEREEIRAGLPSFRIIAPADGILRQCPGIRKGSVLSAGTRVGSIVVPGKLVAECFVESRHMDRVRPGMKVRIRMEGNGLSARSWVESTVGSVDADALLINGLPVYRVRCPLSADMWTEGLILPMAGMRFTAAIELSRSSLSSLLTEKLNRHFHPVLAAGQEEKEMP